MLSKRLSTMLLSGAAVAGLGAMAQAALVIDLRATGVTGGGTVANPKNVVGIGPGSVVTMDIFAVTSGQNANNNDEGIISFAGSFLSTGGQNRGTLAATRNSNFLGFGGSNGLAQDLDADGDLDVGSNNDANSANFYSARATTAPQPVLGTEVLVGTVTYTVTSVTPPGLEAAQITFRPRVAGTAGSWFEDGSQVTSSNFSGGTPVNVTGVPEPTTLGLAGLAGLGMLARRRSRA